MHQLVFYVPESHLNAVKEAIFAVGVGRIGDYDHCCWQTRGEGQYRPLAGSNAYQGKVDKLEQVREYKVECVLEDSLIEQAITTLKSAHPYEEVAYSLWPLVTV